MNKKKEREALNCLKRSATLSEDENNDDNVINNINNGKTAASTFWGGRGRVLAPAREIIPRMY